MVVHTFSKWCFHFPSISTWIAQFWKKNPKVSLPWLLGVIRLIFMVMLKTCVIFIICEDHATQLFVSIFVVDSSHFYKFCFLAVSLKVDWEGWLEIKCMWWSWRLQFLHCNRILTSKITFIVDQNHHHHLNKGLLICILL